MAIDLMKLTEHQVSRDLSGYITYVYGAPKVGKTTLGSQMPKPLLLAFERGYNAIPGIIAQDITSWSEVRQVLRELKKPEVQERFATIIVDTVDVAAVYCEKYVCSQNDVDSISQIPYGQGWNKLKKEFEDVFRTITQLGFAVFFISHSKEASFKRPDGTEYTIIRPSVTNTYNSIVENMADIYGYMHTIYEDGQSKVKITLRSTDGTISAGGRFKYIAPEIDSSYDALVKALNDAIDKEAELTNYKYVTNERDTVPAAQVLDFDNLLAEFNQVINKLIETHSEEEFNTNYTPRITQITERYLGKGKKVNNCNRDQVEQLSLIVSEVKDLA
jgi:hypothetical protein